MLGGRQSSQRHFTLVSFIIHCFFNSRTDRRWKFVYQHSAKLAMINCTIKHFQSHFALSWVLNVVPFEHSFFVSLNPAAEELKAPVRIFLDSKMPVTRLWAISRLPEYPEYLIILIKRLMGYLMICLTLTESPWYP